TDGWGLDVVVTGSQKSWMSAPGLTMLSLSARAWEAAERARMPRFYFDVREARKSAEKGQTPWTPAVAVVFQIDVALELMERERRARGGLARIRSGHHPGGRGRRCSTRGTRGTAGGSSDGTGRGGGASVRILVAEPLAKEGVALLRQHHEVDEKVGLSRDELC